MKQQQLHKEAIMSMNHLTAKETIASAIRGEIDASTFEMEAQIYDHEFGKCDYQGNLLGYALKMNLEAESIALIQKHPELCSGYIDFHGYCKVSGDTCSEHLPLSLLALQTESEDAFNLYIQTASFDLNDTASESSLVDQEFWHDSKKTIIELSKQDPEMMARISKWAQKSGVILPKLTPDGRGDAPSAKRNTRKTGPGM